MAAHRFSVSIDPEMIDTVRAAAEAEGLSVSAWIAQIVKDRARLNLLGEALDFWEQEHGPLTEEELADARAFMEDAEREAREKVRENQGRPGESAA